MCVACVCINLAIESIFQRITPPGIEATLSPCGKMEVSLELSKGLRQFCMLILFDFFQRRHKCNNEDLLNIILTMLYISVHFTALYSYLSIFGSENKENLDKLLRLIIQLLDEIQFNQPTINCVRICLEQRLFQPTHLFSLSIQTQG